MIFFFSESNKKKMDQNINYNIATDYAREYGLMDRLDKLKELIKNHHFIYLGIYLLLKIL